LLFLNKIQFGEEPMKIQLSLKQEGKKEMIKIRSRPFCFQGDGLDVLSPLRKPNILYIKQRQEDFERWRE
jgi:hypothetical protein